MDDRFACRLIERILEFAMNGKLGEHGFATRARMLARSSAAMTGTTHAV
jgi:hypothetical protein